MLEIQDKNRKYKAATEYAQKSGKQLLVIGGAHVASRRSATGSEIVPETDHVLTFDGARR